MDTGHGNTVNGSPGNMLMQDPPETNMGDSHGMEMNFSATGNDGFDFDAFLAPDRSGTDDLGRIRNSEMSEQELLTYCPHHPKAD